MWSLLPESDRDMGVVLNWCTFPVAFIMMRFLLFECFQMFFTSSKHSIQLVEQLFFGAARSKFLYVPGELTFELGDLKIKVTSIAWFKIHPGG